MIITSVIILIIAYGALLYDAFRLLRKVIRHYRKERKSMKK